MRRSRFHHVVMACFFSCCYPLLVYSQLPIPDHFPIPPTIPTLLKQQQLPELWSAEGKKLMDRCYGSFRPKKSNVTPGGDFAELAPKLLHTGRRLLGQMLPTVSPQTEYTLGLTFHTRLLKRFRLSNDRALRHRIQQIGQKVTRYATRYDLPYRFFVIDSPLVNAITLPGNFIYIFTGMLNRLQHDGEIAFILAHEISHSIFRHGTQKIQLLQASKKMFGTHARFGRLLFQYIRKAYDQQNEYESDAGGVCLAWYAHYNPLYALRALRHLRLKQTPRPSDLLGRLMYDYHHSHPRTDDRTLRIYQWAQHLIARSRQAHPKR